MTRPLRIEFADAVYHVINRGLERREIVRDDEDRRTWLRLLGRVATRRTWRVFAYALLDNHFHLFLRTPRPDLSDGMHDFQSGFATCFNQRHGRVGPLFQGRFKAVIVEQDSHSWELSRYVHLNPARTDRTPRPEQFSWSSYRFYLNPASAPRWLDWKTVLAEFAGTEAAARIAYRRFVEAGLRRTPTDPFESAADGWILGSPQFVERIRMLSQSTDDSCPAAGVSLGQLVGVVADVFGVRADQVVKRGRQGNVAREAAILLARDVIAEPSGSLAEQFGVGRSAISECVRRARVRTEEDPNFRTRLEAVRRKLVD